MIAALDPAIEATPALEPGLACRAAAGPGFSAILSDLAWPPSDPLPDPGATPSSDPRQAIKAYGDTATDWPADTDNDANAPESDDLTPATPALAIAVPILVEAASVEANAVVAAPGPAAQHDVPVPVGRPTIATQRIDPERLASSPPSSGDSDTVASTAKSAPAKRTEPLLQSLPSDIDPPPTAGSSQTSEPKHTDIQSDENPTASGQRPVIGPEAGVRPAETAPLAQLTPAVATNAAQTVFMPAATPLSRSRTVEPDSLSAAGAPAAAASPRVPHNVNLPGIAAVRPVEPVLSAATLPELTRAGVPAALQLAGRSAGTARERSAPPEIVRAAPAVPAFVSGITEAASPVVADTAPAPRVVPLRVPSPEMLAPPTGHVRDSDNGTLDVTTERLGAISVAVAARETRIGVHFTVDTSVAAGLLSGNAPRLAEGLAGGGGRMEGISVDVRGGNPGDPSRQTPRGEPSRAVPQLPRRPARTTPTGRFA